MKISKKKKIFKKSIEYIIVAIICVGSSVLSAYAATILFASSEVSYDNTSSSIQSDNVQGAIDELYACAQTYASYESRLSTFENNYKSNAFPVGSIYVSATDSTAEAVAARFGGTWVAFGGGRTMVGYQANDTAFDEIEETGGESTHTLTESEMPSHTHSYNKADSSTGDHALTNKEVPEHQHYISGMRFTSDNGGLELELNGNLITYKAGLAHNTTNRLWTTGVTSPSNTTGIRKVTIGNMDGSTATSSVGSGNAHNHTITTTATDTGSSGAASPSAFSITDASIAVYMWKRTA